VLFHSGVRFLSQDRRHQRYLGDRAPLPPSAHPHMGASPYSKASVDRGVVSAKEVEISGRHLLASLHVDLVRNGVKRKA
jgi:hypothetical protein